MAEPGDQDEVLHVPGGENQVVNVIQEKQAKIFTSPLSGIVVLPPRARNSPSWSTAAGDGRQRGSGIDDGDRGSTTELPGQLDVADEGFLVPCECFLY